MDITRNYGLKKPSEDDFYDINVTNANMDKVDEELKKETEKRETADTNLTQSVSNVNAGLSSHVGNNSNPHGVSKSQIGLGNVENKSSATIRGELTNSNVTTALGFTPVQQNGGSGMASNKMYLGWNGSHVLVQVDSTPMGGLITTNNIGSQSVSRAASADRAGYADSSGYATVAGSAGWAADGARAGWADNAGYAPTNSHSHWTSGSFTATGNTQTLVLGWQPSIVIVSLNPEVLGCTNPLAHGDSRFIPHVITSTTGNHDRIVSNGFYMSNLTTGTMYVYIAC